MMGGFNQHTRNMDTTDKERCVVFYERWWKQLQRLPDGERLQVYESIMRYAFRGECTDMVYYLESIMDNIRTTIDLSEARKAEFKRMQKEKSRLATEARRARQKTVTALTVSQRNTECSILSPNAPNSPTDEAGDPTLPTGETGNPTPPTGNPTLPYNKNKNENENKKNTDVVGIRKGVPPSPPSSSLPKESIAIDDECKRVLMHEALALASDSSWSEVVMMRYHLGRAELKERLQDFVLDCVMNGKITHTSAADLKSHFASWLRIQTDIKVKKRHEQNQKEYHSQRRGTEPTAKTAQEYTTRL